MPVGGLPHTGGSRSSTVSVATQASGRHAPFASLPGPAPPRLPQVSDQRVVAVLNGPNLNLLGEREPEIYGSQTLADVESRCRHEAAGHGMAVDFRQTNHEGDFIDWIHELRHTAGGFVVNAGAWTHTSIAIHDALAAVDGPVVEVHISDVHAREEFRHHSYISSLATEVIVGHGVAGYEEAVAAIARLTADEG